ncbi:helix-turn-helix transcriptional regulator [Nocardioides sp. NPDC087217]|uniref:helix-turn-helix transcriptional regulator n=1 Tax=Nocardioides sp. NPDC087217 TaxID=3364335 RepID=UPI0038227513
MGRPSKSARHLRSASSSVDASPAPSSPRSSVPIDPTGAPMFEPLLTIDDLALWLGKPRGTLYQWRTRGLGPRAIKVGNDLRYQRSEVEAWLASQLDTRESA